MTSVVLGGSSCCDDGSSSVPTFTADQIGYLETIAQLRAAQIDSSGDNIAMVGGYYAVGDGGGGFYLWTPTETGADNGGTIINQAGNIGTGRWMLQNYGQPISIMQFGAKMDGATDDTAAINSGLANVDDLFVPAGNSYVAGTLAMAQDGQKFHGVSASGDDAGSVLTFGSGAADCISMTGSWQQLYDLNINASARIGIIGTPNPTIIAPVSASNCCAVGIYTGVHTQLARLAIINPWNGILNFCGNALKYEDIAFSGTRGDFCELHYGTSTAPAASSSGARIDHGSASDVTLPVTTTTTVGSVIPMSNTAGIQTGWAVSGSVAFPAGSLVVAVTPNVSIQINGNITLSLLVGTELTFQNQVDALWLDSYFSGYDGHAIRNTGVACVLQIGDEVNSGTSFPQDVRIYDLNGNGLGINDKVSITAGHDINLTESRILGNTASGGGRGVLFGANAKNLRIDGCEIARHQFVGVAIAGDGCQLIGCTIGENSQAGDSVSDGVTISTTASRIIITDCQIGYLFGAGGSQRYGVNNLGVSPSEIILDGNDLRNNDIGPVNDPLQFTLGINQGLSSVGALISSATDYFVTNLPAMPVRATLFAQDDFIRALENAGIWELTDLCYLFAASSPIVALTNLKLPGAGIENPQAANNGAAFVNYAGYTGNGTSEFIDLGVSVGNLANYSLNSAAMFVYSNTNIAANNAYDMGSSTAGNEMINCSDVTGKLVTRSNAITPGSDIVGSSVGLFGWSRLASDHYKTYLNGANLSSQAIASVAVSTGDLWALGSFGGYSARQIPFIWMGGGLTDAQVTSLYNAIVAYLAAV